MVKHKYTIKPSSSLPRDLLREVKTICLHKALKVRSSLAHQSQQVETVHENGYNIYPESGMPRSNEQIMKYLHMLQHV